MTRCFTVHNFSIKTRELVWSCGHSYSQQARACVKVISLRTHVCDNARGEIRLSDWQAALGWLFHSAAFFKVYTNKICFLRHFQVKVMSIWTKKMAHGLNWLYGFAWKVQIFPQLFRVEGSMVEASSTSCCCWSNLLASRTHDVNLRWHDFFAVLHPDVPQSGVQTTTLPAKKKWSNLTKLTRLNEHLDLWAMTWISWIIFGHPALCDHPGADGDCPQHLTLSPVRSL